MWKTIVRCNPSSHLLYNLTHERHPSHIDCSRVFCPAALALVRHTGPARQRGLLPCRPPVAMVGRSLRHDRCQRKRSHLCERPRHGNRLGHDLSADVHGFCLRLPAGGICPAARLLPTRPHHHLHLSPLPLRAQGPSHRLGDVLLQQARRGQHPPVPCGHHPAAPHLRQPGHSLLGQYGPATPADVVLHQGERHTHHRVERLHADPRTAHGPRAHHLPTGLSDGAPCPRHGPPDCTKPHEPGV